MKFQRLRGTHDIFGDDAAAFQKVESLAREIFARFGFSELRTPVLEHKELFTRALGTETDVVQKEMYEFTDRSGEQVAMRPEGTAGVVRAYLENNFDKTMGLAKLYYLGPMFRSERPQAGRLRQFHQIGVEAMGTDSPYADAETIHCLVTFLEAAGAGGFTVKMNNLGTFEERDSFKAELKKYFKPHAKALCEDCRNRFEKNVFRLLDCKVPGCRTLIEKSPTITAHLSEASQTHFSKVLEGLEHSGVRAVIDPFLVRGLDYYTKTVFEISHPRLGAQDALAAGGRYDTLVSAFGGDRAGSVGFAIGLERLLMCVVPEKAVDKPFEQGFFVVTLGENAFKKGFELLSLLRADGVRAEMDFNAKSMKSQMRSADKTRFNYALILGDDELAKNEFVLKDLKIGQQKSADLKRLSEIAQDPQQLFR